MSKTKFKALPRRFNDDFANDGVWFAPYDDAIDVEFPSFKLALVDQTSNRFIETAERLSDQVKADDSRAGFRQPKKMSKRERTEQEAATFVKNFIEIAMVDWTVEDEAGKVVPFTKALACDYFDHNDQDKRWLLRQCVEFASDIRNYQPVGQSELPEGN